MAALAADLEAVRVAVQAAVEKKEGRWDDGDWSVFFEDVGATTHSSRRCCAPSESLGKAAAPSRQQARTRGASPFAPTV